MGTCELKIDKRAGDPGRVKAIMAVNTICNKLLSKHDVTLKNLWVIMATNLHKWSKDSKDTEKYYEDFRHFQIVLGRKIGEPIADVDSSARDIVWENINITCRELRHEHGASWQDLWFSFSLNLMSIAKLVDLPQQDLEDLERWHFVIGCKISNELNQHPRKAA